MATTSVVFAHNQTGQVDGLRATRLICRVLANCGISATPLPVQVTLCNDVAMSKPSHVRANVAPTPGAVIKFWGPGEGERFGRIGEEYIGCVVPIIEDRWLADAAIVAADDPSRGFHVDPLLVEIDRKEFLMDLLPLDVTMRGGTAITYEARPDDRSYESLSGWADDITYYVDAVEKLLDENGVCARA
jgi:hypothetical protein